MDPASAILKSAAEDEVVQGYVITAVGQQTEVFLLDINPRDAIVSRQPEESIIVPLYAVVISGWDEVGRHALILPSLHHE